MFHVGLQLRMHSSTGATIEFEVQKKLFDDHSAYSLSNHLALSLFRIACFSRTILKANILERNG